jgi:hypothetical protein
MTDKRKLWKPDGTPRYIQCRDAADCGDRYTVWFTGRPPLRNDEWVQYRAMSEHPFNPQGIGLWGEIERYKLRSYPGGKRISFADLPDDCRKLVLRDYRDIWRIKA